MLDLRYPMGMMFALVGAMMAFYGFCTNSGDAHEIYEQHSLNINVNLWWGAALLVFGLVMFALAQWSAKRDKSQK